MKYGREAVWVKKRFLKVTTWRCGKKCQIFTSLNDCFYLEKCVKFLLRDLPSNARTSIAKICHLTGLHLTFQALQPLKYCLISTTLHKESYQLAKYFKDFHYCPGWFTIFGFFCFIFFSNSDSVRYFSLKILSDNVTVYCWKKKNEIQMRCKLYCVQFNW